MERKRKAEVTKSLNAIPEASKRLAGFNTSSKPAAAKSATVASAAPAEVGKVAQSGPAPGEESFEDIAARTGATVSDILNKRMAVRGHQI